MSDHTSAVNLDATKSAVLLTPEDYFVIKEKFTKRTSQWEESCTVNIPTAIEATRSHSPGKKISRSTFVDDMLLRM
jgi:hypothetical protein